MKIYHSSSSQSKKCAVCGKKTSTYKIYEQTNISITIPLCNGNCYNKTNVKNLADFAIKAIKNEIGKEE